MKRVLVALLLSCALSFGASLALAQSTDGITIGTRRVVQSQVLKEDRTVYVYFEMAADAYPESWTAWNALGEAYVAKGDQHRASRMYERSLLLNPQNENAKQALRSLRAD